MAILALAFVFEVELCRSLYDNCKNQDKSGRDLADELGSIVIYNCKIGHINNTVPVNVFRKITVGEVGGAIIDGSKIGSIHRTILIYISREEHIPAILVMKLGAIYF